MREKKDVEVREGRRVDRRRRGGERARERVSVCVCVCVIEEKSGSEERSREERDDPFRGHDSAGGPK